MPTVDSSGRPAQLPAPENVEMNVRDLLTTIRTTIEYRSVPLRKPLGRRHPLRYEKQMTYELFILLRQVIERRDGFAWYDQNVDRRLRVDVPKRQARWILKDDVGRDFPVCNPFEKRFYRHVCMKFASD